MKPCLNLYFTGAPEGGMARLLEALRAAGGRAVGPADTQRLPIEIALAEPDLLSYAAEVAVAGDPTGWTATVTGAPFWSVAVHWPAQSDARPALEAGAALLDTLAALGRVDFAVLHALPDELNLNDLDPYRAGILCRCPAEEYAKDGPAGIGAQTVLGPRLVGLMEAGPRQALTSAGRARPDGSLLLGEPALALDPEGAERLRHWTETFRLAGVALEIARERGRYRERPGPRWQPLPPSPQAHPLSADAEEALEELRGSDEDSPARDVQVDHLVAPFAALPGVHAENLELESAVLLCADLSQAVIQDAGFVKADLRGVNAGGARFIDVSLVGADLRWASFRDAELPITRLDQANCEHADLTGAAKLESAEGASFDDAVGEGWAPENAYLRGATFRGASLQKAAFDGADLQGAVFDGADLTGARFRGADLTGASFRGCRMEGVDLQDATTEGAVFDRARP